MIITPNEGYIWQLRKLVEPPETLAKNGYIMQPLNDDELFMKKRCLGCGKTMHQLRVKQSPNNGPPPQANKADITPSKITPSQPTIQEGLNIKSLQTATKSGVSEAPKFSCRYHPGQLIRKVWTCCNRNASAEPCVGTNMHIPQNISTDALADKYQVHSTPRVVHMQRSPRVAVALDCEMGTAASGDSEPIRVTLIDYFSKEILVNNIIFPDVSMRHLNTKYSGVSWDDMNKAKRQQTCLWGVKGTREALWRHIGPGTIVVGHGANNDLRALRWMHSSVVDSLIIESTRAKREELRKSAEIESADEGRVGQKGDNGDIRLTPFSTTATGIAESTEETAPKVTVVRKPRQLSLKSLAKLRLGRDIQTGGKKGHDSLEDATAARDLVHWSIMNPDEASH
ncbi:hypothetical protein BDU57DRAFT_541469 [Ampelomyces quisqualis]|uniref:Exonuclease domain-containing protein n=1 Tax=Ampelomyces quisqualis TaxID=50730 RepID=A0A6A5QBG5_AMPQU|nr:hypothetical protein BDU57DRAFT_541469 [Ampelomyces quisqualis]